MDAAKLIELVQQYPHLFDKQRMDYKDRGKCVNSWDEIAADLGYITKYFDCFLNEMVTMG